MSFPDKVFHTFTPLKLVEVKTVELSGLKLVVCIYPIESFPNSSRLTVRLSSFASCISMVSSKANQYLPSLLYLTSYSSRLACTNSPLVPFHIFVGGKLEYSEELY